MRRRVRLAVAIPLLLALVFTSAAGCDGKVEKKRMVGQQHQLLVVSGGEHRRERWVDVDKFAYDNCDKGETYPACGTTGYDNPEGREQQADKKRDKERREDPKGDNCSRLVQLVVTWQPDMFMRIDWFIEDRNGRQHGTVTRHNGTFSESRRAVCAGGFAGIKAEPEAGMAPDVCIPLVRVNGRVVSSNNPFRNGEPCNVNAAIP